MTAPLQPQFNPADLWERLVTAGLSGAEATHHVQLRLANTPQAVQQIYQQDVDPGVLASGGLGAADMMSFGLGDQTARMVLGETAAQTQQQAQAQHGSAHLIGEGLGFLGPAAVEVGLAKAGALVPTVIGAAVRGVKNRVARAAAKTALHAASGAGYAALQAGGRTEGGLDQRGQAALRAAPYGAAVGAALPLGAAFIEQAVRPFTKAGSRAITRLAGKAGPRIEEAPISQVPTPKTIDPLEVATAIRRGIIEPSTAGTRGYRPAGPKTSKPGKPIWYGSGSPTKSAAVRGGERLLPDPRPGALLRQTPFQTLQATLREPSTPQMVKDAILQEIQRRGIIGEGLLGAL